VQIVGLMWFNGVIKVALTESHLFLEGFNEGAKTNICH
jgi:hypothetical protein